MDLLNFGGDQRLDRGDLTFALSAVPTGLVNELTGSFCVAPGESAIVTGFRPRASGASAVVVGEAGVPNVAFLGQRVGAVVTPGVLTTQGPASQTLSVATLPAATYNIYVRFNRLPGVSQSRKFWAKSLPGNEYSQLQDTRQVATWELRLETTAPSGEWVSLGTAVVTSSGAGQGNTVVVTDQRLLFFEGRPDQAYAPAWGTSSDRSTQRSSANTGNLRRHLDALRQCLIDIKGRGLATWYQPNISGMQIGSAFTLADTPAANTLAVGDNNYTFVCVNDQIRQTLNGLDDYWAYIRSSGDWSRISPNGTSIFQHAKSGAMRIGVGGTTGFLSVNSSAASQYTIAAQNTSTASAYLGILAPQAKNAYLDFGAVFGTPQMQIRATWTGFPTARFYLGNDSRQFLTAFYDTGALKITTNVAGDTVTINGTSVIKQSIIWASGYYKGGTGTVVPFYTSQPGMTYSVSISGANAVILSFSQAIPDGAIVTATSVYNSGANKVYAISTATSTASAAFYCQGTGDTSISSAQSFYFTISYGA